MIDYIQLSSKGLLEEFGKGKHKPGSGSAAAFEGLLSAQLISTVIKLSKGKVNYKKWLPKYNSILDEIERQIYPDLIKYFQLDSVEFDKVIKLRDRLKKETNPEEQRVIKQHLENATIVATRIPLEIATLSSKLAGHAIFLCEYGYQTARGDSGVAASGAIASISGCLSIINLNFLYLGYNQESEYIRQEADKLKVQHLELSTDLAERLNNLEDAARTYRAYRKDLQEFASGRWVDSKLSYSGIEQLVRSVQNTLWKHRGRFLKNHEQENIIELLKPQIVLTDILGYLYEEHETLGQNFVGEDFFEVAGIIDNKEKIVSVSQRFSKETMNFTAAHELGHAMLHRQNGLHRDKALDGSSTATVKDPVELEANKFATFFLMPKKQVESRFKQVFLTDKFRINQDTVFALTKGRVSDFKKECKSLHDLSRILTQAEFYGDQPFISLARYFSVSIETMAIRLEELQLVEFN